MKILIPIFCFIMMASCQKTKKEKVHVFEIKEITLEAKNEYQNPYTEIECWLDLKGPDFNKRIYGFWDGGNTFRIRIAATKPGDWTWTSSSNQTDVGLNKKSGSFSAINWTEQEIKENPNRHGFIEATPNGHALQYADGTPFFFLGDTWWAASTWRYPLTGNGPDSNWVPSPEGHSFENIVHYRQKQGYNSLAMIACYPNWADDDYPAVVVDSNGIGVRDPWDKFGASTAKDMHDELGNRPFSIKDGGPMADYDQINPSYFQSLDKKMDYLASVGFVPFMETVRRDHGPSWKAYFDWPNSFVRYIQYIAARYGAHNFILSPIHLDWIPPVHSLSGDEFNEALLVWHKKYGSLPYGQPVTSLIDGATHITYGSNEKVPWLTMHSVGNNPRNHGFYPWLEEQFKLDPPKPTTNLEAFYPGWDQYAVTLVAGERTEWNSDRDNYFGRTQAWGSVFSGGLAGHIYGTGAYDGTTVGEDEGERPFIWDALKYPAGEQVGYLRKFLESEGALYQHFQLASNNLIPRKSIGSLPNGLDGWAFMICLEDKSLSMLYFENACEIPLIKGFTPNSKYTLIWFNPITGEWTEKQNINSNEKGEINLGKFPDNQIISVQDWSLKIIQ